MYLLMHIRLLHTVRFSWCRFVQLEESRRGALPSARVTTAYLVTKLASRTLRSPATARPPHHTKLRSEQSALGCTCRRRARAEVMQRCLCAAL